MTRLHIYNLSDDKIQFWNTNKFKDWGFDDPGTGFGFFEPGEDHLFGDDDDTITGYLNWEPRYSPPFTSEGGPIAKIEFTSILDAQVVRVTDNTGNLSPYVLSFYRKDRVKVGDGYMYRYIQHDKWQNFDIEDEGNSRERRWGVPPDRALGGKLFTLGELPDFRQKYPTFVTRSFAGLDIFDLVVEDVSNAPTWH